MQIDGFIRGNTRIVALVGYPVAHSISPIIHNHAFKSLALPYCYVALPVPPHAIHTLAPLFRAANFAGANITIPHKSALTHYCDRLSPLSIATGTVNTLYWEGTSLCGTTTDPEGFTRAVAAAGHDLDNSNVIILGNGGTARTLAIALSLEKRIASLTIAGRNSSKISDLAIEVSEKTGFTVASLSFDNPFLMDAASRCTLLVNCTNVGMHPDTEATPLPSRFFHPGMTVFDAIYNPSETRLLREAKAAGCRTENGLRMLLYQGLASFTYWTGKRVPDDLFPISQLQSFIERR